MGNTPSSGSSNSGLKSTNSLNKNDIYNEILKDAQKLRLHDKKNDYNPHRRSQSIKLNLPKQLQSYSDAIHIVNEFWLNYIEKLNDNELNELVTVLYCHLFLKCKKIRNILLLIQNNQNHKISSHGVKIFNIFGYIIRNLINPSNHLKFFKQLQALGNVHKAHCLTNDIYESILNSFNYCMEEKFTNKYKIRTRFCFSQLYRVIIDIMTGEDFYSFTMRRLSTPSPLSPLLRVTSPILRRFSSARENKTDPDHIEVIHGVDTSSSSLNEMDDDNDIYDDDEEFNDMMSINRRSSTQRQILYNQIDGFLGSLEECLSDEIGSLYFKKYLSEQFCVENFLFHQAVLKYKSAKSTQRIKLGEEIMNEFVEIGAEKEVNLSYNTRNTILTIVNLVKRMNDNKEKYHQLLSCKHIMNEDDIKYLKKPNDGHYRMATTKKLPLQLAEVTNDANENINDVIYSMGFTESLFDKAYNEIFDLMRTNSWNKFRKCILDYCGDDEFVKLQKEKLKLKKQEQQSNITMIKAINAISKSHKKHKPKPKSIRNVLNQPQNNNNNKHKTSVIIINTNKNHKNHKQTFPYKPRKVVGDNKKKNNNSLLSPRFDRKSPVIAPLSELRQISTESFKTDDDDDNDNEDTMIFNDCDDDDDDDDDDNAILEDSEVTMKMEQFKNGNKASLMPRLSFIPSLMPQIEKSETSPTVNSTYYVRTNIISDIATPGGGAAVDIHENNNNLHSNNNNNNNIKNNGNYSPSELFNLVSSVQPPPKLNNNHNWEYSNNTNTKHGSSGIYKASNNKSSKNKPLYKTHKKRKTKSKRKSLKQPVSKHTDFKSV